MEKLKLLLWVLIAVGVFIYRLLKKARETTATERRERPQPPAVPGLPTASFQELLRQMQARTPADAPVPSAAPEVFPSPATITSRTPAGRALPRETAAPARSQERTKVRNKSLETRGTDRPLSPPTPVPRRGSTLPRAVVTSQASSAFSSYAGATPPAETPAAGVRRLLSEPASVRAAFVLSEVFQRRF